MRVQELVGNLQCAPIDRNPVHATLDATPYDTGALEHFDMLRHAVERHRERFRHHPHGQLARLAKQRDDPASSGIGQGVKDAAEPLLFAGLAAPRAQTDAPASSRSAYCLVPVVDLDIMWRRSTSAGFDKLLEAEHERRPLHAAMGHELDGLAPVPVPEQDDGVIAVLR